MTAASSKHQKHTLVVALICSATLLCIALLLPKIAPNGLRLATEISLYLSLAILWNLLAGYSGLLSVGQQAYVGIGAYAFFAAFVFWQLPLPISVLIGVSVGGFSALVFSVFLFRLSGPFFAVGTWVVAEVALLTIASLETFGGGSGIALPIALAKELGKTTVERNMLIFNVSIALLTFVFVGCYVLLRSRVGLALMAIRDNEAAAGSLGVRTKSLKRVMFIAVAGATAAAGAVVLLMKLRVNPDSAFSLIDWTAYVLFIVVIGGIGRFEGPLVGTTIFFALRMLFADFGVLYLVLLGAVAIFVMLKAPQGVWGELSNRYGWEIFPMRRVFSKESKGENHG